MSNKRHILIGSGINSLVAAALLAKRGEQVLVLEREPRLGGCMMTAEITEPGFYHDVMAATFVLFVTSPAFSELGESLADHGLEFCHTEKPTATLRPDGSHVILTTDRAKNVIEFNRLSPGDGDQHNSDVSEIECDADFIFALLSSPLWSWPTARLFLRRAWLKGLNELKAWIGTALVPARAWIEAGYKSLEVQALLAPWVLHTGLNPESTYSGQMGRVIAFALEAAGAPIVKGGAENASKAFRSLIEAHGGEVRTEVEAKRIITENGKVIALETAEGERIKAASIIASVTPSQLYGELLHDTSHREDFDPSLFRHGRGNFQLHYALSGDPEWHAEGLEDVALIHLADGIDSVSKSSNEAERGLLPEAPTICVGQPHKLDPSRCPPGKGILWVQVPDAPRVLKGDAANEIDTKPDWDEFAREKFADRIEEFLRSHIKNFDDIKLNRCALSPLDLEKINKNLVGGDPYGGSCSIDQFFVWRPFSSSKNNSTGVKNLFHIGASTHPGPGLSGGSGYNLAKRLGA